MEASLGSGLPELLGQVASSAIWLLYEVARLLLGQGAYLTEDLPMADSVSDWINNP